MDWELSTGRARNPGRACNGLERHESIPGTSVPGRGKEDAPRCVTTGSTVLAVGRSVAAAVLHVVTWVQTTKVELNRCCHRPFYFTCSLPE